ncbi:MAG TPA: zinc ribbon domain-containing protein [Herpetosiphonaceae bacterium]
MFCAHCGAALAKNAEFCLACGEPAASLPSLRDSDLINIAVSCVGVAESDKDAAGGYEWPGRAFAGRCEIAITDLVTRQVVAAAHPARCVIYSYALHGQTTTICSANVESHLPLDQEVVAFVTETCGRGWNLLPIIQRLRTPGPDSPNGQAALAPSPAGAATTIRIDLLNIDLQRR